MLLDRNLLPGSTPGATVAAMRPLFVEFIGFPGAGKTTIANAVERLLASRGYRAAHQPLLVEGTASHLRHALGLRWFRLLNWRLRLAGLRYAMSVRPRRLSRWQYIQQMLFRAYHQRVLQRRDYQVILLCQSFVQTAWSTAVDGDAFELTRLESLFAQLYCETAGSTAFVFVDLDPSLAAKRVGERSRPGSRFDALPFERVEIALTTHRETMRTLTDCAVHTTGAPILRVEGSEPVAENVVRIAHFIEGLLRAGEPA